MGVPYHVIVEPQEFAEYAAVIDPKKLLALDLDYKRRYDTIDPVGDERGMGTGSGPARNFAWQHSIERGAAWHWVMDDNIKGFFRFNRNLKVPVADGTVLRCMEDFALRYANVTMAGPNYFMFASRKAKSKPFTLNTRIYSCNLIRNDAPFRWRCRFNEDTDLSLRMLKAGFATILFNAFLQYKMPTQSVRGGNTTELYGDGTLLKSKVLAALHPDCAKLVWRFGRAHHHVDYKRFTTPLVRHAETVVAAGVDNYGMTLRQLA